MERMEYKYLYETHLHTNHASACAKNNVMEMIDAAMAYGYAGIIITEHNWGGNTSVPWYLEWEKWVDEFAKGYRIAQDYVKEKQLNFDVFWGYEAGFEGTEFLIYGVTPEWLKTHPEMKDATIEEQYQLIHEAGGMVVHAHPFREEWYIPEVRLYPEFVDAVEAVNATHSNSRSYHHNNPEFDTKAIQYAKKYHLPMTAGSDIHRTDMLGGGVAFKKRLGSVQEYVDAILHGGDYLLTNGEEWFDPTF